MSMTYLCMDFGCGHARVRGDDDEHWLGVDAYPVAGVDVAAVWSRTQRALPFRDGVFNRVRLSHVLEHVVDPVDLLSECRRIVRRGGHVEVRVPHHTSIWAHEVNHRSYYNAFSLDVLFADSDASAEGRALFELGERTVVLRCPPDRGGRAPGFLVRRAERLVNRHVFFAELHLLKLVGAYEIRFVLHPIDVVSGDIVDTSRE
ncbi:MAG: methyltransferase domain-containing protein [Acidimicrobiales bacterium]